MIDSPTKGRLLLVDDEVNVLKSLQRVFSMQGYETFTALNASEGLDILNQQAIDVIISDMRMPITDGATFLKNAAERWPEIKRILLTGYADMDSIISAVNKGKIDYYLSKPWDNEQIVRVIDNMLESKHLRDQNIKLQQLLNQQNEELKSLNNNLEEKIQERTASLLMAYQDLKASNESTIQLVSSIVEMHEGHYKGHCENIVKHSVLLAKAAKLSEVEVNNIKLAAMLHNIGKMGLPPEIEFKPFNTLTVNESIEFRKYPVFGATVLSAFKPLKDVADTILHHREYYNGNGFPNRLKEQNIPLSSRILAITVAYHELQEGLIFKEKFPAQEALEHLAISSNEIFDPNLVTLFEKIMTEHTDEQVALAEVLYKPFELKPGMSLSRDLVSKYGFKLLAKDQILSEHIIEVIKSLRDNSSLKLYVKKSE